MRMFADKHPICLNKVEKGELGEFVATCYLQKRGWREIERNARIGGCELDIVAYDPDGVMVVVEVKFCEKTGDGYSPESHLNLRKVRAVARGAQMFADKHPKLAGRGFRVDAICLSPRDPAVLTEKEDDYVINYYKNILSSFAE